MVHYETTRGGTEGKKRTSMRGDNIEFDGTELRFDKDVFTVEMVDFEVRRIIRDDNYLIESKDENGRIEIRYAYDIEIDQFGYNRGPIIIEDMGGHIYMDLSKADATMTQIIKQSFKGEAFIDSILDSFGFDKDEFPFR